MLLLISSPRCNPSNTRHSALQVKDHPRHRLVSILFRSSDQEATISVQTAVDLAPLNNVLFTDALTKRESISKLLVAGQCQVKWPITSSDDKLSRTVTWQFKLGPGTANEIQFRLSVQMP